MKDSDPMDLLPPSPETLENARTLLKSMGKAPQMYASVREAYIAQVVTVLLLVYPSFDAVGFYKTHLGTEGCAYKGILDPVTTEWADKVITAANFLIPEGDPYRHNLEMAIRSFLESGKIFPLGKLYYLVKDADSGEYLIGSKKGHHPEAGTIRKLLAFARSWGAFVPEKDDNIEEIHRTVYESMVWDGVFAPQGEETNYIKRLHRSEDSAVEFTRNAFREGIKILRAREEVLEENFEEGWNSEHSEGKIVAWVEVPGGVYARKVYYSVTEKQLDYTIHP